MAAETMNAAAERFAGQGVESIFLYTHEAHPGEYYPYLTSMEQKFEHAHALRDKLGVNRPILLDALDGACHRAYGSMPNMTWIFNRAGTVLYKAGWTDAGSVVDALEYYLRVPERRKQDKRLSLFQVERLDIMRRIVKHFIAGWSVMVQKRLRNFGRQLGRMIQKGTL